MEKVAYLDFDMLIESSEKGYIARVLNSPAGEASGRYLNPFSDLELDNIALQLGRPRRGVRRLESPEMETARQFGRRLFEATFTEAVRDRLRSSLSIVNRQGNGLRLRLRLANAPELANIPWEYLYDPTLDRFLVLSVNTPLVRYLEVPDYIRPLAVKPPLEVLLMISSPKDYPPLDVEREWQKMEEALGGLVQNGLIHLTRLKEPTLDSLRRQIRSGEYHIFHFIGHGGFDKSSQDGVLVMEDEDGRSRAISGRYLGTIMHDHRPLRLAILNACEGARTSHDDPFAGSAQSLVQQGIPAVIAMQFEITDDAAITFAHEFYGAVADGYPVDGALGEARKAIFAQGNDIEWGTPVLYLCTPDGQIFDIAPSESIRQPVVEAAKSSDTLEVRLDRLYTDALSAYWLGEWEKACEGFQTILTLRPNHKDAAARLEESRRQLKLQTLYTQARSAEDSRDWAGAIVALEELIGVETKYKDAPIRLENVKRQKSLDDLYQQAQTLHQAGRWQAVINVFAQINAIDPAYPDQQNLLATARSQDEAQKSQAELDKLYTQAVREIDARQWQTARQILSQVQAQKSAYRETEKLLKLIQAELDAEEAQIRPVEAAKPEPKVEAQKSQAAAETPAVQAGKVTAPAPSIATALPIIVVGWIFAIFLPLALNSDLTYLTVANIATFSVMGIVAGGSTWLGLRVMNARLDWKASLGFILGWSACFAIYGLIGLYFDTTEVWYLTAALSGALVGLITGLVLQHSLPGIKEKHIGLISLAWSVGLLMGEIVYAWVWDYSSSLAPILYFSITGLIGGWVTLAQLKNSQVLLNQAGGRLTPQTSDVADMKPLENWLTRRMDWKVMLAGMIGFTIGLYGVSYLVDLASESSALILVPLVWGAIGGASLAIPQLSVKKMLLLGLLGGAGMFLGGVVWGLANLPEPIYKIGYAYISSWSIDPFLYLLTGLGLGAALGISTRKGSSLLFLSVAGGLVFLLAYLVLKILNPTSSTGEIRPWTVILACGLVGGVMGATWSYLQNSTSPKKHLSGNPPG